MERQQEASGIPIWLGEEERQDDRQRLQLSGLISTLNFANAAVRILNLSRGGCCLNSDTTVRVGNFVTLALPGFTAIDGWVAWTTQNKVGLSFAHALPMRVVDYIVRLSGGEPSDFTRSGELLR